jgi:uncharacterized damage-inducible protein DinB
MTMIRNFRTVLSLALLLACSGLVYARQAKAGEPRTIGEVLEQSATNLEHEFVSGASAMPEEKYSFLPTAGEFKGVRTFAAQVKHTAAVNYLFAAAILGEKPPVDINHEDGPAELKSKAEILKFLNDSFAYLRRALATLDEKNLVEPMASPFGEGTVTRLGLAASALAHPMDHYGQMVEYLRMNGIVPPASR